MTRLLSSRIQADGEHVATVMDVAMEHCASGVKLVWLPPERRRRYPSTSVRLSECESVHPHVRLCSRYQIERHKLGSRSACQSRRRLRIRYAALRRCVKTDLPWISMTRSCHRRRPATWAETAVGSSGMSQWYVCNRWSRPLYCCCRHLLKHGRKEQTTCEYPRIG